MQAALLPIALELAPYGLGSTLLADPDEQGYAVKHLLDNERQLACRILTALAPRRVEVIGRVGAPDPRLGLAWISSLTFYGQRFDDMALADPDFRLRRKIALQSEDMSRRHLARDDRYPVVGSYYSTFRSILSVKRRVPFVLLSDSLGAARSFPVVLLDCADRDLAADLATSLRLLLNRRQRLRVPAYVPAFAAPALDDGIDVEEISVDDFDKYFPARLGH